MGATARITGAGEGSLPLFNVYNAEISMIGNNLFTNGQIVFINPARSVMGSPCDPNSSAFRLGIGGYFVVTGVEHILERGKYETLVKATWMSQCVGGRSRAASKCAGGTNTPATPPAE